MASIDCDVTLPSHGNYWVLLGITWNIYSINLNDYIFENMYHYFTTSCPVLEQWQNIRLQ